MLMRIEEAERVVLTGRVISRRTCYLGWRLRQNFTRGRFALSIDTK